MYETGLESASKDLQDFFVSPNAYRSLLILIVALVIAYVLSRFFAAGIVKIAQIIGTRSEGISNREKLIRYRQIETYLSISIAFVRGAVVAVVAYVVWRLLSPGASSGAAAVGASAFFIVIAGQTLGTFLRDVMSGATMITEGWFHVGDFIKVEPFIDVAGVVERFTLRSTKVRSLSGDVIWIHNQQIHAVHVTKNATRTYVVDIFTRQPEVAKISIQEVIDAVPSSTALVKSPIRIASTKEWSSGLWHISIEAKTAPGREWLIENFFINALKEIDEGREKNKKVLVYEPTARFADPVAEKKFRRSIR
jgi:hypothetical protein